MAVVLVPVLRRRNDSMRDTTVTMCALPTTTALTKTVVAGRLLCGVLGFPLTRTRALVLS